MGNLLPCFKGNKQDLEDEDKPKEYSWDKRPAIDPKDFTIENKNGETIVKKPGSVNGMQFIIQNLENCTVYIFDHIAQLNIDDCKNCKFFIGPSKGSVFIRDSSDCNLAVICQQFRTRDCKRINTFIMCTTQPIIEASTYMKFGCISANYSLLSEHMKKASLCAYNNNWNNIHDFTPIPGEVNYTFLNKESAIEEFVPYPEESVKNELNMTYEKKSSVIPYTLGTQFRQTSESCLIAFFVNDSTPEALNQQEQNVRNVLASISTNFADLSLVQAKQYMLSELSSESVFGSKNYDKFLKKGEIIGLEFNGLECISKCQQIVSALNTELIFISQPSEKVKRQIDSFYNFAEMQMAV